ncbi:hypothetical protein C0J52_06522 [Blattella germanica]|nr:hypothetical protein C0J52_06522 [Blattella germanica]
MRKVYYSCKPQWGFQDLSIIKELNFLSGHHSQCVLKIFCTLSSYKPLGEKFPDFVNGTLVPYWKDLIITGIPKEVKYAVRCICSHIRERDESLLVGVLEEFVASMSGSELYLAGLISLGYFGTYLSDKFSKSWLLKLFNVSKNALDKLIFQDSESLTPDDDPWHQKTDLPYDIRCKVEALKAITRFVIRLNNKSLTNTVMDVLKKIIQGNGAYSETDKLTVSAKAWLRLTCGCCFLKLCDAKRIYDHIPRKAFFQMAKLMKDESPVVRRRFVTKLSKKLRQWKKQKFGLPSVFISYFALCALEKNYTLKSEMENELNQLYTGISQMHHQLPQVFPDFCVHVAVELLALLVYDTIDSIKSVEQVYSCLEFLFKALFETKNRIFVHFSTDYFSGVFDNIRECKNIVEPENDVLNKKMWAVCEIGKFFLSTVPFKLNNKAISPASRVDPSYILYCSIDNTNIKHLPKNVDKYLMESLIKRKVIVGAKTKVLLDEEETEYEESTSDEEQVHYNFHFCYNYLD